MNPPPDIGADPCAKCGRGHSPMVMCDGAPRPRCCGICGVADIPYGVEWPYWSEGRPIHAHCAYPIVCPGCQQRNKMMTCVQSADGSKVPTLDETTVCVCDVCLCIYTIGLGWRTRALTREEISKFPQDVQVVIVQAVSVAASISVQRMLDTLTGQRRKVV